MRDKMDARLTVAGFFESGLADDRWTAPQIEDYVFRLGFRG